MNSLETLEQRKKELLLRKEIAKLEAQERTDSALPKFSSWWVVVPLWAIGALALLLGFADSGLRPFLAIGFALIGAAVMLRVRGSRRR